VGDGDPGEQLAELLVVADGQQQVARHDAGLLVVLGGVARELQDLRLEDGARNQRQICVEGKQENREGRGGDGDGGWMRTSAARYSRTAAR
jgi:hypothetical protein